MRNNFSKQYPTEMCDLFVAMAEPKRERRPGFKSVDGAPSALEQFSRIVARVHAAANISGFLMPDCFGKYPDE